MSMTFQTHLILFLAAALTLAACGSNEAAPTDEAPAAATAPEAASEPEVPEQESVSEQSAAPADIIRGAGGLEEKCLERVDQETGGNALGINRISESEAAIEIYVNVDGATAPWKCLGWKDGTIAEVMFTGSEGEL